MAPDDAPGAVSTRSLERARRRLIVRRLPLFAACWVWTTVVWTVVLVVEGLLGFWGALALPILQTGLLLAVLSIVRADSASSRVRPLVVLAVVLLGTSSTALFAAIGGNGDILAFVLLTLYLLSALFFAWGWRTTALVLASTVTLWALVTPLLRFYLPTLELAVAIAIGSSVCLAIAEVTWRTFGTAFERGVREQEATRQLAASLDAYRDLAENASDLIYTHDLEGRFTYVNEAFARYAHARADDIIGRTCEEMVAHHPARPDIAAIIEDVAAGESVPPVALPVDGPSGLRWIECAVSPMRDSSGRVTGVRGIARDVTARRNAEEQLQKSMVDLRSSEEMLRLLAQRQAMIREEERKRIGFDLHDDVCQELVGIGIMLESLRRRLGDAADGPAGLSHISRYLNEVVEHLRGVAHDLRPLLLRDLGLEGSLRSLAEGMSLPTTRVITRFPEPVPRLEEDVEIGIYRIAQEALANALRHARARTITVTLGVAEARLFLDVHDDGCGFLAEDCRRQPHLGLVGMQERALALGGHVEVASEPRRGTHVHLDCPLSMRSLASTA